MISGIYMQPTWISNDKEHTCQFIRTLGTLLPLYGQSPRHRASDDQSEL